MHWNGSNWLGDDGVCHIGIDSGAQEYDAVSEQPGVNIRAALSASDVLSNAWDDHQVLRQDWGYQRGHGQALRPVQGVTGVDPVANAHMKVYETPEQNRPANGRPDLFRMP